MCQARTRELCPDVMMVQPPGEPGRLSSCARELVFIIDVSGSMMASSARDREAPHCMDLGRLRPTDKFQRRAVLRMSALLAENEEVSRLRRRPRGSEGRPKFIRRAARRRREPRSSPAWLAIFQARTMQMPRIEDNVFRAASYRVGPMASIAEKRARGVCC